MATTAVQRLSRNGNSSPASTIDLSDTKSRILDAAEELFMEHGFEATSLRLITTAAAVNLAAVNYHFGSKEELFQAVLTRRLDPMNQDRMQLLSAYETAADGKPLTCEKILAAMFIPALKLARDHEQGGKNFLRLLGRAYADPAPFIREFLSSQYREMIARFRAAFSFALPHIPREELSWRLHFVMGALSYTLAGADMLKIISQLQPHEATNDELLLQRLAPFLAAGLRSPCAPNNTGPSDDDGQHFFQEA
ncbi:MAG: TetR/AcrR family transcriptional regulator [Betaproteobacteria bacterium]